jgi:hypothetical protein
MIYVHLQWVDAQETRVTFRLLDLSGRNHDASSPLETKSLVQERGVSLRSVWLLGMTGSLPVIFSTFKTRAHSRHMRLFLTTVSITNSVQQSPSRETETERRG